MTKDPQFTLAFNIQTTNEERLEAAGLYQKAFHARILSQNTPPGGDALHIRLEIYGLQILLGPGSAVGTGVENAILCEVRFGRESEFRNAYETLSQDAQKASLGGPYPWAKLSALVTDKFGVGWALYLNE